jgi:outer membrane protein OmpA-like peptidoglycan-associated protein
MAQALSLHDHVHEPEPARPRARGAGGAILAVLLVAGQGALGYFGYRVHQQNQALAQQVDVLAQKADRAAADAQAARERAQRAEDAASAAAQGRDAAQLQSASARQEAESARQEATSAKETAEKAQAEAARVKAQAEAEIGRLQTALGQVAETRRTALGLVMNLSGDHLKFEFDKADLRPQDRELLARVAGILLTAPDHTISVNGFTDDVGSDDYNQKLSLRRAQAVRDYLVASGLPASIFTVEGHGKTMPLVAGTSDVARAKNRRVELAIATFKIQYGAR